MLESSNCMFYVKIFVPKSLNWCLHVPFHWLLNVVGNKSAFALFRIGLGHPRKNEREFQKWKLHSSLDTYVLR